MSTRIAPSGTIDELLAAPITVGEPDVAGALAVFPLFGAEPRLDYLSFAEAATRGLKLTEMPQGASVNDLRVVNPLDVPVLLYEGEELIGAQQNRTVDAAILVPARSETVIPVSCVEQHRWDASRHGEAFTPSAQAAYPQLRRHKSRQIRERLAAGEPARADQGEVWREVGAKADRLGSTSPTGAMSDIYDQRGDALTELRSAVTRRDGQLGALAAIAGSFAVLDCVSRPDVFAALHAPLVRGYALDAVEHPPADAPASADAAAFVAEVTRLPAARRPSAGLGRTVHFSSASIGGTGLAHEGELVQLCAYAEDGGRRSTRIQRPSRRR